jgi:hypothetical protein
VTRWKALLRNRDRPSEGPVQLPARGSKLPIGIQKNAVVAIDNPPIDAIEHNSGVTHVTLIRDAEIVPHP